MISGGQTRGLEAKLHLCDRRAIGIIISSSLVVVFVLMPLKYVESLFSTYR